MAADTPAWHVLPSPQVTGRLGVAAETGLSAAEVERRAAAYGRNDIDEPQRRRPWRMLLDQFTDLMIVVLIAAAVVSGLIGDPEDTVAIAVIVVLNGLVGFAQEYRAERAVAALKVLAAPSATVRREGQMVTLPASQLVPGDIVLLEAGNIVPADLRLLEAVQLQVDEAALTGESVPVDKHTAALRTADVALGDRLNMAYKGTLVSHGHACGVVVATGMHTELGRIAGLLRATESPQTPLQRRLARFGRRLSLGVIAICAVVFGAGLLRGEPAALMFLTAVSLAVAAIPEALPAVVTASLALGARTMARHHALIRRLPAVEALGSVTYICADKTGTLTQNRMRVEQLFADGQRQSPPPPPGAAAEPWPLLYTALALSTDAVRSDRGVLTGDPTEVALCLAAAAAGYDKAALGADWPRRAEIVFDAERKCMTTFHQHGDALLSFTKGAPEQVIERCDTVLGSIGLLAIDAASVLRMATDMAADGLRVLAIAYRRWPALPVGRNPEAVESRLTLLGLVGLRDPPRPEARDAVATCRSAGITPVMITGDHPATARAIAARLGIIDHDDRVMTGQQLARLSASAFAEQVRRIRVYARVAPTQKIAIVQALQDHGELVAMTGDGVNDAPALARADIGVAMGKTGTDVARESSHLILLDDNFATIVAAVREGRRIFDNMRKFIRYALTCNSGEIWTIFLAPFLGLPLPLLPIHILWINLITDGLPGLALAAEPEERGIMQRPPRAPQESLFAGGMWQHIVWVGLLMGAVTLFTQAWAWHGRSPHWQTMVFTVLALSQMGHVLAIRSERESLFRHGAFSNRPLLGTVVVTVALQMATIYVPALHPILKTQQLSATELAVCLLLSAVVFVAVEVEKWLVRQGRLYQSSGNG